MAKNQNLTYGIFITWIFCIFMNVSCKREEISINDSNSDKYFSYNGTDPEIKSLVNALKQLNRKEHFTAKYTAQTNISWDHAYRIYSAKQTDSIKYNVPIIGEDGIVNQFLSISKHQNSIPEIPISNRFENDFTENNIERQILAVSTFEPFVVRGLKIPHEIEDLKKHLIINESISAEKKDKLLTDLNIGFSASKRSKISRINIKSMETNSSNSCSAILEFEWSYYSNGCSVASGNEAILNRIVNHLDQRLGPIPQIYKIEYNQFKGVIITGDPSYISANTSYFISLVRELTGSITFECVMGGSLYFTRINANNNCSQTGGGGGGTGNSPSPPIIISPSDRIRYPALAKIVDNLYNKVKTDNKLMQMLKSFTRLSENQILENLKPGKGPLLLVSDPSQFKYAGTLGLYENGMLYISSDVASNLNYFSTTYSTAAELFITCTILHEFIHFGENFTQTFVNHSGNYDDAGFQFENAYYGGRVSFNSLTGEITYLPL